MASQLEQLLDPRRRIAGKAAFEIAALSPMKDIPARVIPDPQSRLQPPVVHFGWVFDPETCRTIAAERRFSSLRIDDDSDQSDEDEEIGKEDVAYWVAYYGGEENMSEEMLIGIRESVNMQLFKDLTAVLMKKLDIWDPNEEFVQPVLALSDGEPDACMRFALSIGDNFHLDEMPSNEVLAKIKKEFRFDREAGWFMDALDTKWVRY